MRNSNLTRAVVCVALLAIAVAAPFVVHPVFAMQILCFALFASAFNLVAGYLGLISFGHAAFFGTAAYLAGHAVKVWGWPTELAILYATGVAMLMGVVFGLLAVRSKGVYFAMITLALSQLVYYVAHQSPFTGGEDGMPAIPRGSLFGVIPLSNQYAMYAFVLTITGVGIAIIYRAINAPFGKLLVAIRDNEQRVTSLGYDVVRIKLLAFVISATLTGLAGATKAIVFQFASQADIVWAMSGVPVLATLIGGIGTLVGPLIGALVLIGSEHWLAGAGQWVFFIQGALFVTVVLFFRRGIWGEYLAFAERRRRRRTGAPPPPPESNGH